MLKTRLIFAFIILAFSLNIVACKHKPPAPPDEQFATYDHKVLYAGETLGLIAKWYTGSLDNWKAILNYNPGLDEKRIRIGQVIKIPKSLMTKSQPLPKNFIGSSTTTGTSAPSTQEAPSIIEASEAPVATTPQAEIKVPTLAPIIVITAAPTAATVTVPTKPTKSVEDMENFDFDDESQPSTKTRDELLKELTEDY